jgi:hypothetical protein
MVLCIYVYFTSMNMLKQLVPLAAALIGPVVVGIIFIGNSAVIIGLWTAHFIWTYYCVAKYTYMFLLLTNFFFFFFKSQLFLCDWLHFLAYNFRTKKLGLVLKIVVLVLLPVPLVLLPIFGIVGSLLGGVGYGLFAPLLATFEAVGENVTDKFYHCFVVSFLCVFAVFVSWD